MKNINLIVISIISAIFLSACGSSMYEQPYWKPTSQKSDWEIDSLICEEKARVAEADAQELAANEALTNNLQNLNRQQGGKDLSGVFALLGSLSQSSIHSQAKSDEFIKCMKNKHWQKKEQKSKEK